MAGYAATAASTNSRPPTRRRTSGGAGYTTLAQRQALYDQKVKQRSFTLHYGQTLAWQAQRDGYRIVTLFAGTGGGKTWFGPRFFYPILSSPGGLTKTYLFLEPTFRMLKRVMLPVVTEFFDAFDLGRMRYNDMEYEFHQGGRIVFGSVDNPNSIQGLHVDGGAWADEIGLYTEEAWDVILQRTAFHKAPILNTSTPYSLPWCERRLSKPAHEGRTASEYWFKQFPSYWNPAYPRDQFLALKRSWPREKFERLMLGLFTRIGGLVFEEFREDRNLATIYPYDGGRRLYFHHPIEGQRDVEVVRAWAAQDWGWTDPGCQLLFAEDGLGRRYVFEEDYESYVQVEQGTDRDEDTWTARALRRHERWGLDALYCDPSMPAYIDAMVKWGLPAVGATNNQQYGIDIVNAAMMPLGGGNGAGLYIAQNACPNLVRTIGSYVRKKGAGDFYLPKAADHQEDHCFVAGTRVATSQGHLPIETIKSGMLVLTRKGYRRVIASGMTNPNAEVKTVRFSNGTSLTGTGNHPIWIEGKGFCTIDSLRYGDIMVVEPTYKELLLCRRMNHLANQSISAKQRSYCTRGYPSDVILAAYTSILGIISFRGQCFDNVEWEGFTKNSIEILLGRFLRGAKSTIKTSIPSTIRLRICNVLHAMSISQYMSERSQTSIEAKNGTKSSKPPDAKRVIGINRVRDGIGTGSMVEMLGRADSPKNAFVNNAVHLSPPLPFGKTTDSVQIAVNPNGVEQPDSTISSNAVNGVEESSLATSTTKPGFAGEDAVAVIAVHCNLNRQPVFNITVEDIPEYFAEGVLVHNCEDTLRYGVTGTGKPGQDDHIVGVPPVVYGAMKGRSKEADDLTRRFKKGRHIGTPGSLH